MNELTKKDKEVIGGLFEMVGYCQARLNKRFASPVKQPDSKYIGRLMADFAVKVEQFEKDLTEQAKELGYDG